MMALKDGPFSKYIMVVMEEEVSELATFQSKHNCTMADSGCPPFSQLQLVRFSPLNS